MKAISIALFAGMVGCAFIQSVPAAEAATFTEKVLHSFANGSDGANPYANLVDVNGTLYGTTVDGGGTGCNGSGCGTVFSIDANTGAEKVLYSFCGQPNCADGAIPTAGLIDVSGTLYGTTQVGGAVGCGNNLGCGTVFALDTKTGVEKVLYSFCPQVNCTDGVAPSGGLIDLKGTLYGTTYSGGTTGSGTAFALNPNTGAESVLYSFCSQQNCTDGAYPYAGLIALNGTLYGTTGYGGSMSCSGSGCGTVFSINPKTGAEKVLYSFCSQPNCTDGVYPDAGLIAVKGELYGTTIFGGRTGCSRDGCGTAFSLDPNTGKETVLYAFCQQQDCPDGALPSAGLIDVKGTLYGTTAYGGQTGCPQTGDCGTVFSIDPNTGSETVLYEFCSKKNCTDGWGPSASLIAVKDALYGTTPNGGAYGYGTVFALKTKR